MYEKLPEGIRAFDDTQSIRNNIYNYSKDAIAARFPIEDDLYRIDIDNLDYEDEKEKSLDEQKKAILTYHNLGASLKGRLTLTDRRTNKVLDSREDVIARVPYYSPRGTIINNGSEYAIVNQSRLRPGVYTRRKASGETEAQFNVIPGSGKGFRMNMDPDTGTFRLNLAQSQAPAYPFLKAMGITDQEMVDTWGKELWEVNSKGRNTGALKRIYERFAGRLANPDAGDEEIGMWLRENLKNYKMDPRIVQSTLGLKDQEGIDNKVLLRTTQRILNVGRGHEDPDDRDSPRYKMFLGPEDLYKERIERDVGQLGRNLLYKVRRSKNLKPFHRGLMTKYFDSLLQGSGLALPLEESNPSHYLEQMNRVTAMGEGGIRSSSAITDDARGIAGNQLGFLDPIAGPESEKIGIDARFTYGTYKGNDGNIYGKFTNARTGKEELLPPYEVSNKVLAFPGFQNAKTKYVTAIKNGKTTRALRKDVDYYLPNTARMFSQGVNLNPMPTSMQAGRQFYAAKFGTQFLPVADSEAPLVDTLTPDGKTTFRQYYGRKAATLSSGVDGTVTSVRGDKITVTDDEGKKHTYDAVKNFPFNRLTGISYTPIVEKGTRVNKGDMIAKSNFTDDTGSLNLGRNLKVAVIPAKGESHDDAIVISESAAQKLATDRLYGFDLAAKHGIEFGKDKYMSLFANNYTKEQYETLDDDGVVKPGTILRKGDPMILGIGPKLLTAGDAALGKLHKTLRNAFTDRAVTWDHDYEGTVVDAVNVRGRHANVNVTSRVPVQVADKLCVDKETEVLTREGWKYFKDLTDDDKVCSLNPETKEFDYLEPVSRTSYRYKGLMYKIESQQIDQLVTPNHKLYGKLRSIKKDNDFGFHLPEDIYGKTFEYKKDGIWVGYGQPTGELLANSVNQFYETIPLGSIPEWLFDLPPKYIETLFKHFIPADTTTKVYTTASKKMADDIQRLCLHAGVSGYITEEVPLDGSSVIYRVHISDSDPTPTVNHSHVNKQKAQLEGWVEYDDTVYCVTLPKWHVMYTRRNGKPVWTGNSNNFAVKGVVGSVWGDDEKEPSDLTIGEIRPDKLMPQDVATGEPYEMLINPMTVQSRVSPNVIMELALGKVAKKLGKPIHLPQDPPEEGWAQYAENLLKEHGVSDTADIFDPETGRIVKDVGDGYTYMNVFHHLAEKKLSARGGSGGYDIHEQPSKGGYTGAKRISGLDLGALLAHGVPHVIKDSMAIRGTKNEEYWKTLRSGNPLPNPGVPFIYTKFLNTLKAGGINPIESGSKTQILPMTDKAVENMAKYEVQSGDLLDDNFRPRPGGLFDPGTTGGTEGLNWTYVKLDDPLPNPVMEEPIRRVLNLKVKELEDIIAGKQELNGKTGGEALYSALANVDPEKVLEDMKKEISSKRGSARDNAVKVASYMDACINNDIHPREWMVSKVPVLPPKFRPVARLGDMALSADMNELYRDLLEVRNNIRVLKEEVGEDIPEERTTLYNAVKAVYGLGKPITPEGQSKNLKGALHQITGDIPKCYDSETEILTYNGWVPFPEVDETMEIGTVNLETGELEYQLPQEVIHQRYVGPMVRTKTHKVDLLVTPNHNHYMETRRVVNKQAGDPETQWTALEKTEAAQLLYTVARKRMLTAPMVGKEGTTPEVPSSTGFKIKDYEAFAAFIGLFISEGWTTDTQTNICQATHSRCVGYIDSVMEATGIPYTRPVYNDGGTIWWVVTDILFTQWVKDNFGVLSTGKKISRKVLNWDHKYLRCLLEGYVRGDGEYRPKANEDPKDNITFYNRDPITNYGNRASTVSRELVNDLAVLCMHIGLGFRLTDIIDYPDKPQWNTQYRFRIDGWNRVVLEYKEQHSWEDYDGQVHCVTVPNGTVIVRRNGFTAVSGNSGLFQRQVISKTVDGVGRAVLTPDPSFDMDTIGLPRDAAWDTYEDFVIRKLARRGYPLLKAKEMVKERDKVAEGLLIEAMQERPVLVDRAPTWHKFNLQAYNPVIVDDTTIRVSPLILRGLSGDADGDECVNRVVIRFRENHVGIVCKHLGLTNQTPPDIVGGMINKTQIITKDGVGFITSVDLADMPHGGMIYRKEGKNGEIHFYEMEDGIEVAAYDETTGKMKWVQPTVWSYHPQREIEVVDYIDGSQTYTDDDPRAVYGIPIDSEDLVPQRFTPSDALEKVVAVPKADLAPVYDETGIDSITPEEFVGTDYATIPLTHEFGRFLGIMVGDGWWDKRGYGNLENRWSLYCADNEGYQADKIKKALLSVFKVPTEDLCLTTRKQTKENDPSRFGDTTKYTYSFKGADKLCNFLSDQLDGHRDHATSGCGNKKLPYFFLAGNPEFRKGLICGLMDTDGSISIAAPRPKDDNGKAYRARLGAGFCTTSFRLAIETRLLFMSLGVRASITGGKSTTSGNPCWYVNPSVMDLKRTDILRGMSNTRKLELFDSQDVEQVEYLTMADGVPVPLPLYEVLNNLTPTAKNPDLRDDGHSNKILLHRTKKTNLLTRKSARKVLDYTDNKIKEQNELVERARTMEYDKEGLKVISEALKVIAPSYIKNKDKELYNTRCRACAAISVALRTDTELSATNIIYIQSLLKLPAYGYGPKSTLVDTWRKIIDSEHIGWITVTGVQKTGIKEDGYDLTVPGYETFASIEGIVLSNTLTWHVPVSDKAVQEAREKMMPSRNLIMTGDLRNPMHTPKQEMSMGLYALTRAPSKKAPVRFRTAQEAKDAYSKGLISANDPIDITG